jgi:pimeloyl-ACP methyl ester carboxylesterase
MLFELLRLLGLIGLAAGVLGLLIVAILVRGTRHPRRRTTAYALARGLPMDPGDLGLPFESWTVDRPDGASLAVWDARPEGGDGRTVAFVHGWGAGRIDSLARFAADRDLWMEAGGRFLFYDLRGHGESDGPSHLGDGEDDDLAALLEAADERGVLLVGHSMGAAVAIEAATGPARDRVAGVIASGAYDRFETSVRGRLRADDLPARPFTSLAMLWLRARGLRLASLSESVERLACPVLFIHGTDDEVTPLGDAERLAEIAPDGRLVTIEGALHGTAHTVDPPRHAQAIRDWLPQLAADS